ncbi:MAG: M4 family metallopeptidase, partial [Bacteroidetes bacterium]|nr:M4 family metallopeptidase [Bacteroidota bacterium]
MKKFYFFSLLQPLAITLLIAQQSNFSDPPSVAMKSILQDGSTKDWHTFREDVTFNKQNPSAFFDQYKEPFGLKQGYGMELGRTIEEPDLQMSHYNFQQTYQGKKIIGAKYKLHYDDKTQKLKGNGTVINQFSNNQKVNISEQEAWNAAIAYMEAPLSNLSDNLELVWYGNYSDRMEDYQLTYQADVFASPENGKRVFVSAVDKEVLGSQPLVLDVDDLGSAQTLYNGTQDIYTNLIGGFYELIEYSFPGTSTEIETRNMNFQNDYALSIPYTDSDNNWTDMNEQHGTQVQWGARHAFNYFFTEHNRNSYDNAGLKIRAYADYGFNYGGAFYSILDPKITFGSGNATRGPVGSLDVVAHEFSHGITMHTAELIFMDESGALNESFSDIFGTVIEHYVANVDPNTQANWLIAEKTTLNGLGLRSMEDPNASPYLDPDTYKGTYWVPAGTCCDNGGVHSNSGVQNHWFYLLTQGGSDTNDNGDVYNVLGIGMDDAASIAYRNLIIYLDENSQFADARQGSIEAAGDLFGDNSLEQIQVTEAWYAVGVGNPFTSNDVGVSNIRLVGANPLCNTRQVQIDVMNFSTIDVIPENTNIPVSYSVDGLNPVNAVLTLPMGTNLMPEETFTYTFNQLPVFTQSNSVLTANTSYPLDLFTDNDEQSITVRLSGTYTVGGVNPDYFTLQNAIDDLSSGGVIFCGPVSLQIRTGNYSESVVIGDISGSTTVDSPLIIESETGNKVDVTISSSETSTIILEGAKHLVLRNLTIQNTASNFDRGIILLKNSSENITIENNTIISVPAGSDHNNLIGVLYEEEVPGVPIIFQNDGLYIYNNDFLNGKNSIFLQDFVIEGRIIFSNVEILNNSIQNFKEKGINIYDVKNATIRNNVLNTDNAFRGIDISQSESKGGNFLLEKNQIIIPESAQFGIGFTGNSAVDPTVSVINNFVDLKASQGVCIGIEILSAMGNVFHNTVRIVPGVVEPNNSRTFSSAFTSLQVQNNIFYNTVTNAIGVRNWQIGASTFDYNDLYIPNGVTGEVDGVAVANLIDWRAAGNGQNSLDIDPQFISDTDLHLGGPQSLIGTLLPAVPVDIDNEQRINPFMGADELYFDIALSGIDVTVNSPCANTTGDLSVTVENYGNTLLTYLPVELNIAGVDQPLYEWTGSLSPGSSTVIDLGNYSLSGSDILVTASISTLGDINPADNVITKSIINQTVSGT